MNVSWNMGIEMTDDAYLCFLQLHITSGSASLYIQMNHDWKTEKATVEILSGSMVNINKSSYLDGTCATHFIMTKVTTAATRT